MQRFTDDRYYLEQYRGPARNLVNGFRQFYFATRLGVKEVDKEIRF